MSRIIFFLIVLLLFFGLDYYTWVAFRTTFNNSKTARYVYWGIHSVCYALFIFIIVCMALQVKPTPFMFVLMSLALAMYIPKLFVVPILLLEDLTRGMGWVLHQAGIWKKDQPVDLSRAKFVSQLAIGVASLPFIGLLYGIFKGKYDYMVRKVDLLIDNLPASFEGLTITQISDIHVGSFDNKSAVQRGIDMINAQNSDLVFFTGDLINTHIEEMEGWVPVFSQIKAKEGVYSILGNHDYADYPAFRDPAEKGPHREKMIATHKELGWNLLLNRNTILERNGEKIAIIGMENWGKAFSRYGNIELAKQGTEDIGVKLLLSHDPTFFEEFVPSHHPDIQATFSGHTHGGQMGVELGSLRISYSQMLYKYWAGLYQINKQYLYVNRGFGFMGFSGRAGIWPEITVFTLKKA